MTDLKNINEFLEGELACLKQIQEECGKAKHIQSLLNSTCESLKEDLKKERDIIRIWTNSGRTTHEALYNNKWKRGLGYTDVKEEVTSTKKENIFQPIRPLSVPVKFVDYEPTLKFKMNKDQTTKSDESEPELLKKSVPDSKKSTLSTLEKITKIYRVKEKNTGLLSKGKLEKRISDKTGKIKPEAPKRNKNGKQGIDKSNNYAYIQNAPRKTCFNCGNTNHLAIDRKKV